MNYSKLSSEVLIACKMEEPVIDILCQSGALELRLEKSESGGVKLAALIVSDEAREMLPGCGKLVMKKLCEVCDHQGLEIELLAKPLPKPHKSGKIPTFITLSKLVSFYAHHGFVEVRGHASLTSCKMERKPSNPPPLHKKMQ